MTQSVFVYGTLKRQYLQQPRHWTAVARPWLEPIAPALLACVWLGPATVSGRLYRVSYYPALVPGDGAEQVSGELYQLPSGPQGEVLLQQLDAYEACSANDPQPHEYRRQCLSVRGSDGRLQPAWVYCYQWPVHGLTHLPAGVF